MCYLPACFGASRLCKLVSTNRDLVLPSKMHGLNTSFPGRCLQQPCSLASQVKPCRMRARHVRVCAQTGEGLQGISLPRQATAPVTDQAVPEGHKSLHGFLYGDEGADAHRSSRYEFREGEDDGCSIMPVSGYLESRDGEKPLGVYAIYDDRHNLQYVGYSRNMVLAVKGHLSRVGEERCCFIRPMVFANKAMASRTHMEALAADWLQEAGTLPPGNGVEAHIWQGTVASASEDEDPLSTVDVSLLSPAERAEYEEKRLKLRKAMGESILDDADLDADSAQRRLALIAAVEGDNWSSVVHEQTQETLQAAVAAGSDRQHSRPMDVPSLAVAAAGAGGDSSSASSSSNAASAAGSGVIVSPFTQPTVHRQVGEKQRPPAEAAPEMTVAAVDAALNDVRPYLLADGGDVEVVGVEDGVVAVSLQGACSSCASSSATLKMGIERQLKAVFGDQLVEVVQIDAGGGRPKASVQAIDLHLNMLRSAVANLKGAVEVASVGSGIAVLHYRGPAPIGKGLVAAVKDAFPDIKEVILKDFPASEEQQQQQS